MIMNDFTVIIDTREQKPFSFPNSEKGTLKTGDYSLKGYEDQIVIERKSIPDLFGSFGKGRTRFEKEYQRLSKFKYKALVIEGDLKTILKGAEFSSMKPEIIIKSSLSWYVKYGVPPLFCSSVKLANKLTHELLSQFFKNIKKGSI